MATKRFNYLGDFSLDNTKVGIGTSNASETLEVVGGTTGKTLVGASCLRLGCSNNIFSFFLKSFFKIEILGM